MRSLKPRKDKGSEKPANDEPPTQTLLSNVAIELELRGDEKLQTALRIAMGIEPLTSKHDMDWVRKILRKKTQMEMQLLALLAIRSASLAGTPGDVAKFVSDMSAAFPYTMAKVPSEHVIDQTSRSENLQHVVLHDKTDKEETKAILNRLFGPRMTAIPMLEDVIAGSDDDDDDD